MTWEEIERLMAFIREQNTRIAARLARITIKVDDTWERAAALLATVKARATETRDLSSPKRQREADERGRRIDERLKALSDMVERQISEGRNGRT